MNKKGLFTEFRITEHLVIKNRSVMAPVYLGHNGHSKEFIDFYIKRAEGGVGMLIIPQSTADPLESWLIPDFSDGFRKLLLKAHNNNVKVILQTYENIDDINKITVKELQKLPQKYAEAAKAIRNAGFDGIELHGAHYTPYAAFLSPKQNRRKDSYGINFEGKTRIILETVQAVKEAVPDFPLFYRFSADDFVENGVGIEFTTKLAIELEKSGVDCLDISAGTMDSPENSIFPKADMPMGCFGSLIKKIKDNVNIPVIGVGRIGDEASAQSMLTMDQADMVAIGRGLIADPDIVIKIQKNREKDIDKCLYCNKGCLTDTLFQGKPIKCYINPNLNDRR